MIGSTADQTSLFEHPLDVLRTLQTWQAQGQPSALCIVVETIGGAVRDPGALMAVNASAGSVGYVSGGCVDSDVVHHAARAIAEGKPKRLVYGVGSPYIDLPLPCGGGITLAVIPNPDPEVIADAVAQLTARQAACLCLDPDFQLQSQQTQTTQCAESVKSALWRQFYYAPKLSIRLAGKGTDALALAQLAIASGYGVTVQTGDTHLFDQASALDNANTRVERLTVPSQPPPLADDPWSAFILLFHDLDWEVALLDQALRGDAFFIGAVGSPRTHQRRVEALMTKGWTPKQLEKIHAPVGLVPSMRDASMLAISCLAQVVQAYRAKVQQDG